MGLGSLLSDPILFLRNALLILPGIVIGLSFHEFAHAWMADKLGDPTPRNQGRVTISPFAHIDPFGMLMLFLFRFGYGKPVYINPNNFRNRRSGELLVSLAGITMNFLVAVVGVFLWNVVILYMNVTNAIVLDILRYIIILNINLMIFNLLPIPPLDGFKVIKTLFLHKNINLFWKFEQYGFMILFILLLTGFVGTWMSFLSNHVLSFITWMFSFMI